MSIDLAEIIARIRADYGAMRCKLMEVCGTHTNAIRRAGIHRQLPAGIRLLSGPGCPVCVTGSGYIEQAISLSREPGLVIASFGDLLRVPGNSGSLAEARAAGAKVRVVYAPQDAVALAEQHPDAQIVFLAVGFETTAPAIALAVRAAAAAGLANFSILPSLKVLEPAMRSLLAGGGLQIDGLIAPGHLGVITGAAGYAFLPREYRLPTVVTGFRPAELWLGIAALLKQIAKGESRLENMYPQAVTEQGNLAARELMAAVFAPEDAEWRGLGTVSGSGLGLAQAYRDYDARCKFGLAEIASREPAGCRCGEILLGRAEPEECPHFDAACTPEHPVGPCMVSAEGSCAAHFYYRSRGGEG
jgi:hydrogenase expression/formation protein HypD